MGGLSLILLAIAAFGLWMSASKLLDALATGRISEQRRVAIRAEEPVRFARYMFSAAVGLVASIGIGLLAVSMTL